MTENKILEVKDLCCSYQKSGGLFGKKESSLWDRELGLSEALAFYAAPALDHQGCLRIFLQLFPPHAP